MKSKLAGQQKLHSTWNPYRQPLPSFCASGCRVIVSLYMTQFRCLCTLKAFSLPLRSPPNNGNISAGDVQARQKRTAPAAHIFLIELSRLWDLRSTASDIRRRDCLHSTSPGTAVGKQTRDWHGTIAIFGDFWRSKLRKTLPLSEKPSSVVRTIPSFASFLFFSFSDRRSSVNENRARAILHATQRKKIRGIF